MAPLSQAQRGNQPSNSPSGAQTKHTLPTSWIPENDDETHSSAVANRLKAYSERDRKRAFDPGYMDFIGGDMEDDLNIGEDEMSSEANSEGEVSKSRSREHALQILKARSRMPAEGIWRSLAS